MKKYIALCLAWLCLSGCLGNSIYFTIDNPTDAKINLKINDITYEIEPHSEVALSLDPGKHSLEGAGLGRVEFIVYANRSGALINPTLSKYVHVSEIYVVNQDKAAQGFSPLNRKIVLDGVEFSGPYTLHEGLFIDKDWSFGVRENFPDSIRVRTGQDGNIKTKLFTQKDFIHYYEDRMKSVGYYEKNKKPDVQDKNVYLKVPDYKFPVFADRAIYAQALKIEQSLKAYLTATTLEEQNRIQNLMHGLIVDFTNIFTERSKELAKELLPEETRKHTEMTDIYRKIITPSAAIIKTDPSR